MSSYPFILELLDGEPLIAVSEPKQINAGDTIQWTRRFRGYGPTTFTLSYALVSRTATYLLNGDMIVANGDGFAVTIPAATTAAWVAGQYRWQAYAADGEGNRHTVGEGEVEILPNLQVQPAGIDDREDDEKILDAIRALIAGKVTEDAQRYMIHGRELQRYTFAELRLLRAEYERRVRAIRIRRGEKLPSRSIGVVFRG